MSQLKLEVGTTPSTPASGFTSLYPKIVSGASILFFKSDDGTEYNLAAGGAVTSVFGRIGAVTAQSGDYNSDQVTEGASNLYYTSSRFNSDFATKTTTNLTEGTNLYYTDARARGAISATAPVSYDNTTGVISMAAATSLVNGYLTSSDWSTFNAKEPAISAGTSLQYWRGDKTFQTLDTSAVPENTNLYFTNTRAISATLTGYTSGAGTVSASDTIIQAIQKLNGNTAALVTGVSSVFGRTGAVTAQSGDYTTDQVTENTNLYYTDARARGAVSASSPISYDSSTGVFSIPVATSLANGYLSSTDWSTFNGKQNALGYTPVNKAGDTMAGALMPYVFTIAYSASITPNASLGNILEVGTLTGNIVINAPTSPTHRQKLEIILTQDGTGGRTASWNSVFYFPPNLTDGVLSTAASKVDRYLFEYNSNATKWVLVGFSLGGDY